MYSEVHDRLITTLLETPGMDDYTVRTSLLANIPNHQILTRHNDPHADVSLIVSELAKMRFSNGDWAPLILIDKVLLRVPNTTWSDQLKELRHLLETEQSVKEQPSEIHEEPEKEENPPNNTYTEPEKGEGQSGDPYSALLQQIQIYHSQVADVQKLLLKAEEPLNKVNILFKAGKGIMQDQCDKAIFYINDLRSALPKAHAVYDKAPYFQGAFPQLSFQIKVLLNDIDDRIDELTSTLRMFRDNCPTLFIVVQVHQSENERAKIENDRKKISEQLGSLLTALKEINTMLHNYLQSLQII